MSKMRSSQSVATAFRARDSVQRNRVVCDGLREEVIDGGFFGERVEEEGIGFIGEIVERIQRRRPFGIETGCKRGNLQIFVRFSMWHGPFTAEAPRRGGRRWRRETVPYFRRRRCDCCLVFLISKARAMTRWATSVRR